MLSVVMINVFTAERSVLIVMLGVFMLSVFRLIVMAPIRRQQTFHSIIFTKYLKSFFEPPLLPILFCFCVELLRYVASRN